MDIDNIIKSRRSIRDFLNKAVSKKIIKECIAAAIWAPSATNQQPWEFIAVCGNELKKISELITEKFSERMQESGSFPDIPEENKKRQEDIFTAIAQAAKSDKIDGAMIFEKSLSFFDAPAVVFFSSYKGCDSQCLLSVAAAVENFLIAAHSKGLGTCWMGIPLVCAKDIEDYLKLPNNKELVAAISIGYPDNDKEINRFKRPRVPAEELTKWVGFDKK